MKKVFYEAPVVELEYAELNQVLCDSLDGTNESFTEDDAFVW